jgi:methionyl-tRNA synthetase
VRKEGAFDKELIEMSISIRASVEEYMDSMQLSSALAEIWKLISRTNKYIDETAPWALAKDESNKSRLAAVMYNLCESIRIISTLIYPFMPNTSPKINEQIGIVSELFNWENSDKWGVLPEGFEVKKGDIIFPRIDMEKELEALNKDQHKNKSDNIEKPEGIAQINIDDFAKVELKVAQIKDCVPVKRAKKLLCLTLDDGSGTPRTVASGIAPWYKPEELIGHKIVLVANLKPAVLCGIESNGMILAADCGENDVKVLFVDYMPTGAKIR